MAAFGDEHLAEWVFDKDLEDLFKEVSCYRATTLKMSKAEMLSYGVSEMFDGVEEYVTKAVPQLKALVAEFPLLGAAGTVRTMEKIQALAKWWEEKFDEKIDIRHVSELRRLKDAMEKDSENRKLRREEEEQRKREEEEQRKREEEERVANERRAFEELREKEDALRRREEELKRWEQDLIKLQSEKEE
jgi:septin family protein